ncbi:MAG: YiiD C-terminal domain-containing protein [Balneolaceae bacterium]
MIQKAISIFVLILIPFFGFSQDIEFGEELDMIYARTAEAMGGQEKWGSTSSFHAEGNWHFPEGGEYIEFIYKNLKPDMARFDFRVNEVLHTVSKYGRRGWIADPDQYLKGYERFDEVEQLVTHNAFLYENNLVDYKEKGLELKFEGSVLIGDREVWLVRLEGFADKEELYYISQGDYKPFIKQSYYFRNGRNGVVNYYIKRYMTVDGIELPREILVTSQHINLILNFSSYVLNSNMDKDDFKNPNEPDFSVNTLSFTKEKAQKYLNSEIPITKQMGIEVERLTTNEVKLKAPIKLNINHRRSAFGGSVDSLFLTAGWSYIRLVVDHLKPLPIIVGSKSQTSFQRPITRDFAAQLVIPSKKEVDEFLDAYIRFGKARITLEAIIKDDGKTYAAFKGDYVVVKSQE